MEKKYIIVYVTFNDENEALTIAKGLIQNKIAACANLIKPIRSIYVWKDKIYDEEEILMTIKTTENLFREVSDYILKMHSYDVPQIVAVPITHGLKEYLSWVDSSTK